MSAVFTYVEFGLANQAGTAPNSIGPFLTWGVTGFDTVAGTYTITCDGVQVALLNPGGSTTQWNGYGLVDPTLDHTLTLKAVSGGVTTTATIRYSAADNSSVWSTSGQLPLVAIPNSLVSSISRNGESWTLVNAFYDGSSFWPANPNEPSAALQLTPAGQLNAYSAPIGAPGPLDSWAPTQLNAAQGTPTVTTAQTGATVTVVGDDRHGLVTWTAGTAPTTGVIATLTFATPLGVTPRVVLVSANNGPAVSAGVYAAGRLSTGFKFYCVVAPAAGAVLAFFYSVES